MTYNCPIIRTKVNNLGRFTNGEAIYKQSQSLFLRRTQEETARIIM